MRCGTRVSAHGTFLGDHVRPKINQRGHNGLELKQRSAAMNSAKSVPSVKAATRTQSSGREVGVFRPSWNHPPALLVLSPVGKETMRTDTTPTRPSHDEDFLPILERATHEVFEIMLGCQVNTILPSQHTLKGGLTAIVGLTGALCGVMTICCSMDTAGRIAKGMLGCTADSDEQAIDALGEMCNMIAGNFESGSARMKDTSEAAFDRIANLLRQHDYRLRIEGHTDNAPIHTSQFPSNWELSTSRATEIVRLLIVREGFAPARLSAAGYAEYHPVATNFTTADRGINRRVDIVILGADLPDPSWIQADSHAKTQVPPIKNTVPTGPIPPKPAVVSVRSVASGHLQQ